MHRGWVRWVSISTEKFCSITGKRSSRLTAVHESNSVSKLRTVWIAREDRICYGIDLGSNMHMRLAADLSKYPFPIASN